MDTYRFFHRGKWRGIGDKVWLNWVFRWRVVSIYDDGVVVLQRGNRYRTMNCQVRVA